ncbi:MAG: TatD family hydrolase [Myxococcota bacterium]
MAYDAHTHLDFPTVPPGAVQRARAAGLTGWCIAGADPAHWDRVIHTATATGGHFALGIHPWVADACAPRCGALLDALDALPTPDAAGEIGLDRNAPGFGSTQEAVARAQLERARARGLPVVLHCVKAHGALLDLLEAHGPLPAGGLVHAFAGSPEVAARYVALGLCLSFGPAVLGSPRGLRAFAATPPGRRLLETDAPDGAPEPAALVELAASLARSGMGTASGLLDETEANARRLFPRVAEPA